MFSHVASARAGVKQCAEGEGERDRLDQLNDPTDVLVDRETDTLLICDRDNRRVMRWPRHPLPTSGNRLGETLRKGRQGQRGHGGRWQS